MSVKWPGGTGVEGSEPMAEKVKSTPNSMGYVELNYAVKGKVSYGSVQNSSGKFVKAGLESVGAAADAAEKVAAEDFRVSITNPPGANAYPICSFTWILVPGQMTDTAKQAALRNFLAWSLRDGQKIAMDMDYGVLPPTILANVRDLVDRYR